MPQFSLGRLLVSTGMISIGLGGFAILIRAGIPLLEDPTVTITAIVAAAFIIAGLFHLFRLGWVGAIVGAIAMIALLIVGAIIEGPH
jgi:hypothetical protein